DCLTSKRDPWWSHVSKTTWKAGDKDQRLMNISGHRRLMTISGPVLNDQLSKRVIEATIIDVAGNASIYRVGNWCIGLDLYDVYAEVPEFARGWDNGWSVTCVKAAPKLEWLPSKRRWTVRESEASL